MIVVSRDLKRYYQTQYGRITSYISNGVEAVTKEMLTDHSVLQKFNLQPKQYVLFLARLVPEKRVHDLLQAYAQVNTGKKLVIAGEGGYTSRYVAELRHKASTDNRVIFTGFQSGLAVHSLFHNASAYVLPSEMEGLPLALLEAISHGIVPVVSDIPPHRELLGSIAGYNLFFAPGDVCGLAESLRKAISRPEHYQELSTRIRAFVQNNYSWDAITTLTEELYYDAVANGPELAFDLSSGAMIQTVMEACGTAVRGEAMRS
jgi:glycosyltransferase involved in cell wall biosynthesis